MIKVPDIKLSKKQIEDLRKVGLLDEIALRNLWIKKEFVRRSRRSKLPKNKSKKIIVQNIANKLGMDPQRVRIIIYQRLVRKKPLIIPIDKL